jgi:uncharacterized protein YegL
MTRTLIVVILDESGSMWETRNDVCGGYNNFIENQKAIVEDKARYILIKFNSIVKTVHRGIDIKNVPKLDKHNYMPNGATALYDAVAEGISIGEKEKKENERVIVLIITDGEENSSKETKRNQLKEIMKAKKKAEDWTLLYIGENPLKWAQDSGMDVVDSIQYDCGDPNLSFDTANRTLSSHRKSDDKKGVNLFNNCKRIDI